MGSVAMVQEAADKCRRLQLDLTRVQEDVNKSKFYARTRTPQQLQAERDSLMLLSFKVAALQAALDACGAGEQGGTYEGMEAARQDLKKAALDCGDNVHVGKDIVTFIETFTRNKFAQFNSRSASINLGVRSSSGILRSFNTMPVGRISGEDSRTPAPPRPTSPPLVDPVEAETEMPQRQRALMQLNSMKVAAPTPPDEAVVPVQPQHRHTKSTPEDDDAVLMDTSEALRDQVACGVNSHFSAAELYDVATASQQSNSRCSSPLDESARGLVEQSFCSDEQEFVERAVLMMPPLPACDEPEMDGYSSYVLPLRPEHAARMNGSGSAALRGSVPSGIGTHPHPSGVNAALMMLRTPQPPPPPLHLLASTMAAPPAQARTQAAPLPPTSKHVSWRSSPTDKTNMMEAHRRSVPVLPTANMAQLSLAPGVAGGSYTGALQQTATEMHVSRRLSHLPASVAAVLPEMAGLGLAGCPWSTSVGEPGSPCAKGYDDFSDEEDMRRSRMTPVLKSRNRRGAFARMAAAVGGAITAGVVTAGAVIAAAALNEQLDELDGKQGQGSGTKGSRSGGRRKRRGNPDIMLGRG